MTLDNNINSVDQLSQQASGNSSFRKVPAPLLTVQYTPVQLNLESINIATPLTPHIRPKSGQKRNKLNAATQGLILPKSHNKFDLHLKPADSEDASTDFGDSDKMSSVLLVGRAFYQRYSQVTQYQQNNYDLFIVTLRVYLIDIILSKKSCLQSFSTLMFEQGECYIFEQEGSIKLDYFISIIFKFLLFKSTLEKFECQNCIYKQLILEINYNLSIIDDCPSYLNHDFEGQPQGAPRSLSNNFYESPIKNFLFPRGQVIETAQGQESCQTIPTLYNNRVRGSSQ